MSPTVPSCSGPTRAWVTRSAPRVPATTAPRTDGDPELLQFGLPGRGSFGTGVDDGTDPDTGPVQVDGGVVGAVVGGEHHRVAAGQHPVAVQVGAGRAGEHDAGSVVVGEHHGSFVRAGGDHDRLGPESPDPLPGSIFRCLDAEVVGAPLQAPARSRRRSCRTRWCAAGAVRRGSRPVRRPRRTPTGPREHRRGSRRWTAATRRPRTARRSARPGLRPGPRSGRRSGRRGRRRPRARRRGGARRRTGRGRDPG